jgi:hypothetical protein
LVEDEGELVPIPVLGEYIIAKHLSPVDALGTLTIPGFQDVVL